MPTPFFDRQGLNLKLYIVISVFKDVMSVTFIKEEK